MTVDFVDQNEIKDNAEKTPLATKQDIPDFLRESSTFPTDNDPNFLRTSLDGGDLRQSAAFTAANLSTIHPGDVTRNQSMM